MGISEIILLAISLSMDAFAVALCKGLALKKIDIKKFFKLNYVKHYLKSIKLFVPMRFVETKKFS